jgi:hypothetical protein
MSQQPPDEWPWNLLTHERIAVAAYFIWENNGRPDGTAAKDWDAGEQFLISQLHLLGGSF